MRRSQPPLEKTMGGNGQILRMNQPPQGPVLATPFNDTQLVAMLAAQVAGSIEGCTPAKAVTAACEIVAEAILQAPSILPRVAMLRKQQHEASQALPSHDVGGEG